MTTGTLTRSVLLRVRTNGRASETRIVEAGTAVDVSRYAGRTSCVVRLPGTLLEQDVSLDTVCLD